MQTDPVTEPQITLREASRQTQRKIRSLASRLSSASGWMRLVAVLAVIGAIIGVFMNWLSILFIWLPLWTSALLFGASRSADSAARSGSEEAMDRSLDRLRLYFKITGIVALIGLVFAVLALIVAVPFRLPFSIGV